MDRAGRDIFVISDVHLGDCGVRDTFEAGGKTPELRAFLDHVGREGGELVILGDLFELWQMNLSRLLVSRREILDQLASLPVVYVPGNHDVDLAHFIGEGFLDHPFFAAMRGPFVRELGGRQFRFFHGHETDPFNAGDEPGFGRMLAIFSGIFEDRNGSPLLASGDAVGDVLEQFGESMLTLWKAAAATLKERLLDQGYEDVHPGAGLTPAQDPDRLVEHVAGVRADRAARGYDVAVLGHTHKPGRIGDWYFNSGSWIGARNTFLRISPSGEVRHFEWKDGAAAQRAMPVVLPDAPEGRPEVKKKRPFEAAAAAARTLFPRPTKPSRARWVLLVQGALALALGLGTLAISIGRGSTAGWRVLVTAFGVYALLDGTMSLLGAAREAPVARLLARVRGAVGLLVGLVVLRRGYVVETFVVLAGVFAFLAGALRVAAALLFQRLVDSRWLALGGGGAMVAGLVLLLFPTSAVLLKVVLAGYLCYYGGGELLAGTFGQPVGRASRASPGSTTCAR